MMINHRTQRLSLSPTRDPEGLKREAFAKILILISPFGIKHDHIPHQQSILPPILHQKSHREFYQQTQDDSR